MKPFSAGKTGLRTEYIKLLLACFLLLSPENIFSQIPFKGFGKLNTIKVDSDFTKLFSFNFNNDEYSDLLLFSPFHKSIQINRGLSGTEFSVPLKAQSPVEISNIKPVLNYNNQVENYAVTSRKQRSLSLIKFNTNGSVSVKDKLVFDSYPENLSVSFNKYENNYEYLLSGNSFRGLSVVKQINKKLEAVQWFTDKIFQNAEFIDLNSDGSDDIIAVDAINNQLHFIFRDSKGGFEDLRQISFADQIISLSVFDINYDQFEDIIISTSSSIVILFGDSFSSFKKSTQIKTLYQADKIAIGDFNRDGFFDFNYLNRETGIVATIFANDFTDYNTDFIHLRDKAIKDLIPYFSKFIYGTAIISDKGEIRILSKVTSLSDAQTFAFGIVPDKIIEFDYQDNGITDIAFTDNFNSSLNIILRDAYGLPEKFFSTNLHDNYANILVFNKSKTNKLFYLYNKGERAIESIEVDCGKYSFHRRIIYSDGPIEDI
ncbi:MAG: VCBS repeat-containing protein, partial [Ignavibacteriaceae bacterium]|nr:VCBS repeat-containing protein [Ignavibacteriaceae bacterium]